MATAKASKAVTIEVPGAVTEPETIIPAVTEPVVQQAQTLQPDTMLIAENEALKRQIEAMNAAAILAAQQTAVSPVAQQAVVAPAAAQVSSKAVLTTSGWKV